MDTGKQIGAAAAMAILMTSALVAWAVAAMVADEPATGQIQTVPASTTSVPETATDPALDPETAAPFDGPRHETYDASIGAPLPGTTHNVTLEVHEDTVEVAEDRYMQLWNFGGTVPGPVIRVTQGDLIHFKIVNKGQMSHSIDFHAAEIAPNRAYIDVGVGESFEFDFTATQPGVFMYHCATAPVLLHIGNGMYGMVIVEPRGQKIEPAREYALVQSELYFGGQGEISDQDKMVAEQPDWIVFNGFANQYLDDPLTAEPGELVRLYVLNAGPSKWSAFHVIGTIFDHTWQEGVVGGPAQTISIAPSQGAIVEFTMEEDGMYPFVTHAFGDAVKGAIGMFKVGDGGPGDGGH